MKVVTNTGLVPVTLHKNGEVVGVQPAEVAGLIDRDEATLFPIPDDVETHDVADPLLASGGPLIVTADVEHKVLKPRSKASAKAPAKAPSKPAPKTKAPKARNADVVIPADWEDLQWMKQAKLAQQIHGGKLPVVDGKKPGEVAADIIKAELARREAAAPAATSSGAAADEAKSTT